MKNILITGVSSGIGLGLTKSLIKSGYKVIGSVRNNETAKKLQFDLGDSFIPVVFDICKTDDVDNAVLQVKKYLDNQKLFAIINNAGSAEIGPLLHVGKNEFMKQLDVLVVGQLNVIQKFYDLLIPDNKNEKTGRIINISSVSGTGANYFFGCYAAGKHALEGLSKTLRLELKLFGIPVVVIAPGNILTSIWEKQTSEIADKYKDTIYYQSIRTSIEKINNQDPEKAMSIEEFCESFMKILEKENIGERYTIVKYKNPKIPFSKAKVKIIDR